MQPLKDFKHGDLIVLGEQKFIIGENPADGKIIGFHTEGLGIITTKDLDKLTRDQGYKIPKGEYKIIIMI